VDLTSHLHNHSITNDFRFNEITFSSLAFNYVVMLLVGTSGSYSINDPLGVISLCELGEQISCGGYFGVF
jgi:hypothetical protein